MLEARGRIGGRCWTHEADDLPAPDGGEKLPLVGRCVDLGAAWIHGVVGNPLAELARQQGVELYQAPSDMVIHGADGAPVPAEDDQEVERAFNELLCQARDAGAAGGPDESLGHVLDRLLEAQGAAHTPAQRQVFQWHCANIEYSAATDIHNLSARHWAIDDEGAFEGPHCLLRQGYGALARGLAQHLDEIRLHAEVAAVRHAPEDAATGAGGGCAVLLRDGSEIEGDMVLVTLPLGVLKARAVRFEPELPPWKVDAIDRMGYGLLNKVRRRRLPAAAAAARAEPPKPPTPTCLRPRTLAACTLSCFPSRVARRRPRKSHGVRGGCQADRRL